MVHYTCQTLTELRLMTIFGIYQSASDPVKKAKLFANGRSQAVRLPKEFRFPGTEVYIERHGEEVVLRPVHSTDKATKKFRTLGELITHIQEGEPVTAEFARTVAEYREWSNAQPPRDVSW
jgi:antitoxin VapB